MKFKYPLALSVLCGVMLVFSSCGGNAMDGTQATSDMANTPTNGVSRPADKADDVIGGTDDSVIPGVPDLTTTPGNVSDMPNTDEPGGMGGVTGGADSRDTAGTSATVTTAPAETAPPVTAPAVRPPEGK